MGLYENVKKAANAKGYSINRLEKELGFARSYIGKFKTITPSVDKIQKIADFLGVSTDYLMTGKEDVPQAPQLNARDKRDIAKDLESIMEKLNNQEDGPASFDGQDIPEDDRELFAAQLEAMLVRLKKINKDLYNPNKNKK
ncbi:MAG: helix-turn-helix domain-containing protein [Clostridiales bacterium]|nr:helix-turn-helix domain-containing protein [Clostridiales bacterium]